MENAKSLKPTETVVHKVNSKRTQAPSLCYCCDRTNHDQRESASSVMPSAISVIKRDISHQPVNRNKARYTNLGEAVSIISEELQKRLFPDAVIKKSYNTYEDIDGGTHVCP